MITLIKFAFAVVNIFKLPYTRHPNSKTSHRKTVPHNTPPNTPRLRRQRQLPNRIRLSTLNFVKYTNLYAQSRRDFSVASEKRLRFPFSFSVYAYPHNYVQYPIVDELHTPDTL